MPVPHHSNDRNGIIFFHKAYMSSVAYRITNNGHLSTLFARAVRGKAPSLTRGSAPGPSPSL